MLLVVPLKWKQILLILFIGSQIFIPLLYYLPWNKNIYDERFSWRMFSVTQQKDVQLDIKFNNVNLNDSEIKKIFPKEWIKTIKHLNPIVLKKSVDYCCNFKYDNLNVSYQFQIHTFKDGNFNLTLFKDCKTFQFYSNKINF